MKRAVLAAACALGTFAFSVRAEIVHFTNPAPGEPGHYDWFAPVEVPRWLDVTLPAAAQSDTESGSTIAQGLGGLPGGVPNIGVLIGGDFNHPGPWSSFAIADDDDMFGLALSHGDALGGRTYSAWSPYAVGTPPFVDSPFPEGAQRYIGVQTADGRYGWVEVARFGQSLAAFAWAYETVPGVPIFAGQVPGPGPVTLLVIGAIASPRRRRR